MRERKKLNDGNLIPGIFNYCDSWCDRCAFTSRCRVYAENEDATDAERDITNEAFWKRFSANLQDAIVMLREMAEERGLDLDSITDDEEFIETQKRHDEYVKKHKLVKLAGDYIKMVDRWFKKIEKDSMLEGDFDEKTTDDEEFECDKDALEIILYYKFFIQVKIQRGLSSRFNEDDEIYDDAEFGRDSDGSVKIALVAIDRSIAAFMSVLRDDNAKITKPIIAKLELLRIQCEKEFPNARSFIRPGFDEIQECIG